MLLRKLIDLRKRLLKDEFETTPAYEARIIEEKKKPLIDRRTIETTYLLVADRVHAEYNADTQVMKHLRSIRKGFPKSERFVHDQDLPVRTI